MFASRHGSINESIELIECVARGLPLSPAKFSHTVHNAQAGLFSIAAGNRRASSSLAAQEDTLGHGWLEALAHLEREPERPLLLVVGDVPLAPTFAPLVKEPVCSYGAAFLLGARRRGHAGLLRARRPRRSSLGPRLARRRGARALVALGRARPRDPRLAAALPLGAGRG